MQPSTLLRDKGLTARWGLNLLLFLKPSWVDATCSWKILSHIGHFSRVIVERFLSALLLSSCSRGPPWNLGQIRQNTESSHVASADRCRAVIRKKEQTPTVIRGVHKSDSKLSNQFQIHNHNSQKLKKSTNHHYLHWFLQNLPVLWSFETMITNNYLILIFLTAWNWQFFHSEILQNWSCINKGLCHTVALPFTLKSILRQKKNYGNSNIFIMQKCNLPKVLYKNQNPSRD
jgi:hypothetical protein